MSRSNGSESYRPRMVLAIDDSAYAAQAGRYFRRHGWEVHLVADGAAVFKQVEACGGSVLILDSAILDGSGWLYWNEWLADQVGLRVVLLVPQRTPHALRLQETLGAAALICHGDELESLSEAVLASSFAEAI